MQAGPSSRDPPITLRFSGGPRTGKDRSPTVVALRRAKGPLCRDGAAFCELFSEPDEKSFGSADVAEPIRVLVLNHFTDELRAVLTEPDEQLVDVVHGEHDA